jgi:hypothetical protein
VDFSKIIWRSHSMSRPLRDSLLVLAWPILNSATQRLTIVYSMGKEPSYVESSSFLNSAAIRLSKEKFINRTNFKFLYSTEIA